MLAQSIPPIDNGALISLARFSITRRASADCGAIAAGTPGSGCQPERDFANGVAEKTMWSIDTGVITVAPGDGRTLVEQTAAEAGFQQQQIGGRPRKSNKRRSSSDFKNVIGAPSFGTSHSSKIVSNAFFRRGAVEHDAFVESHEMRRGIDMHPQSGGLRDRLHECDGGTLSIGAATWMTGGRNCSGLPRAASSVPAPETEIDQFRMKCSQSFKNGVSRMRALAVIAVTRGGIAALIQ